MGQALRTPTIRTAALRQVSVSSADRRDPVPVSDYFGTPVRGIEPRHSGSSMSFFCARTFYGSRIQSLGFYRTRGAVRSYGVPTISKTLPKTLGAILVAGALTLSMGAARAQEPARADGTDATQGAYQDLSPGGQKIAKALFDAQITTDDMAPSADGSAGNAESSPPVKSYSLDEIAAMKRDGLGWGQVFKQLNGQGVIQEKNLGQVVSGANHTFAHSTNSSVSAHGYRPPPTVITYASGNSFTVGSLGHGASRSSVVAAGSGGRHTPSPRAVRGFGGQDTQAVVTVATGASPGNSIGHGVRAHGHPVGNGK